ncbi:hypothetical protein [Lactobacillus nasalidis]|nr:hypothetical protein [Lactobacillus nasalidis]GHV97798.1 hypothetical protein lacNasYZ01_09800 [Lactobacillus nasalidis]GHV99249.1 hypothetical protein lacNasYZ02_06790 [Lactobacillus nasalidis]
MTKLKCNLDDDLAILLRDYAEQQGLDQDAIVNQAVKDLLAKKLGKHKIAQLLKDSEPENDYRLEHFFSGYDWPE